MSNVGDEPELLKYHTVAMTLDNHQHNNDSGSQGEAAGIDEIEFNKTAANQQQQTTSSSSPTPSPMTMAVRTPCSPPDSVGGGGGINNDEHITTNSIITLMQSSPPPHSYRHSRAYRHFKNPPQPHMCIRTTTEAGEELFINVLSWTRIVIPQEPSDPIPLYGGMRVPPGSPRSPPIVFAVMANPEVLKDSGRHSKDPEERRAMVELMCDFVEAMNPGVKLVRNAVILKDRDISGELKDVWNAVQAQRDREREEQMLQQRQQQHYHNITTQQMFPKSGESGASTTITTGPMHQQVSQQYHCVEQQEHFIDGGVIQMTSENQSTMTTRTTATTTVNIETQYFDNVGGEGNTPFNADVNESNIETNPMIDVLSVDSMNQLLATASQATTAIVAAATTEHEESFNTERNNLNGNNDTAAADQTDAGNNKADKNVEETFADIKSNTTRHSANNNNSKNGSPVATGTAITETPTPVTSPRSTNASSGVVTSVTTAMAVSVASNNATPAMPILPSIITKVPTPTPIAPAPTKKDKLGGFLPNGCIFPRFKHNKNKDKDKDKDKESKGKDKEKTLLNALKKSKEKKVAPSEQQLEKAPTTNATTTTTTSDSPIMDGGKSQYEKNFIHLENEVQKLDLNKIDATTGNDNSMFIKLKMSTSSATAK